VTESPAPDPRAGGPVPPADGGPGPSVAPEDPAGAQPPVEGGDAKAQGEVFEGEVLEGEVLDGEVVEPSTTEAAEADALLAEALDAEAIEAQFSAAEADLAKVGVAPGAVIDEVAALTADLQRVHAEYSNYRKRVERDRELVRERAVEAAVVELLPILDDIGRARDHDELVGGFRSVGEALEAVVTRLGLIPFGAVGEPFDPTRHEALMREDRAGVTEPTVVTVLQVGYEMNGRVVRPARVSVAGTD
jgi:molecular chaperone GrpE